jgi:hypothetical protein
MYLICSNNQLTALDMSSNTALMVLICFNNQLTADALNALFRSLPTVGTNEINIWNNPGTGDCDRSIATAKGWQFL